MRGLVIALVTAAGSAGAVEVFVNGVSVEGLTNQRFERATVRIDEKGDVHIEAPGYSVKRSAPAPAAEVRSTAVMSQRYYLVTEQTRPGATEFDIDVIVNGRFFRTLASADPQLVVEVTGELRAGKNALTFKAHKRLEHGEAPRSTSKGDVFRVFLGEGEPRGDQVVIERQLLTFTRTAAEMNDVTQDFSFVTR